MQYLQYDAIVILGQKQIGRWGLPKDLKSRLDKAAELYKSGQSQKLIVSGRWAIHFDLIGVVPAITESKRMRQYLVRKGVHPSDIITEPYSKDTVGNAYYLKQVLRRRGYDYRDLLIICGSPHLARVKYTFGQIFGPDFNFDYLGMQTTDFPNTPEAERRILQQTKEFFDGVRPGHDEKLRHLLYQSKKYRKQILRLE